MSYVGFGQSLGVTSLQSEQDYTPYYVIAGALAVLTVVGAIIMWPGD
jgi:hypothetical protein